MIYSVRPDALDDLEDLVSNIEFVVELSVRSCRFHLLGFSSGTIEGVAVSDADPARVAELVGLMSEAQKVSGVAAR